MRGEGTNHAASPQRSGSGDPFGRSGITRSEERDLVAAAEAGDEAASRRLIEAFLPAIVGMARAYRGTAVDRQELVQEGVAGLLFAARRYDGR